MRILNAKLRAALMAARPTLGAVMALVAMCGAPATAQVVDESAIEQRLRQMVPEDALQPERARIEQSPFGEILLLRDRDFFTFSVTGGGNYTTNAFLRDRGVEDDFIFSLDASLLVATVIAERFEVFAEAAGFGQRYVDNDELNVNGFRGRIGASTTVEGFGIGFAYAPSIAWDDDFDDRFVTLHPLTLSVNRPIEVASDVLLVPGLSGGFTFADPDDFAAANATAAVSAIWLPRSDLSVSLTPNVSYRHYSNYLESLTGKARKDWSYGVFLAATYVPFPNASLQLGIGGNINDSTIGVLDHKVLNVGPSLRFSMRF